MAPLSTTSRRAGVAAPPARSASIGARRPSAATLGATMAVWAPMLFWFAAFRPGLMSADSLAHWAEATRGGWIDLHPPAYTALMWVSATLAGSPSLLTLGQSLLLATGIVAVAKALVRLGAPRTATIVTTAVVATTPMVGAFSVSLWKDIPYTACLLFASARLLDVVAARVQDDEVSARRPLVATAAWLAPAVILRQNGIIFALVVLAAVFLAVPGLRRLATVLGIALVLLVAASKVVVLPALGIQPSPAFATVATLSHDLAAVASSRPDLFDPEDRKVLGTVASFERWTATFPKFGCTSLNWLYHPSFRREGFEGNGRRYLDLWLETVGEAPGAVARNRLCVSSVAWRPDPVGTVYTVSRGVDPNDLGLETVPVVAAANTVGAEVLDFTESASVQWLAWRAPLWIYLAYLMIGIVGRRRVGNALVLAVVPLTAQQLSVIPLNPAQDARYMMFSLVFALLVLPLAAVGGSPAPAVRSSPRTPDTAPAETQQPAVFTPAPPAEQSGRLQRS